MIKVTAKDVARESGVSQSLVSLVINDKKGKSIRPETRQRILETAARMGYKVNANARSMRQQKAGAIGLLSDWDLDSFVFPPILKKVQELCDEKGLSVTLCTGRARDGNFDFIQYFQENRIDGLIYIGMAADPSVDIHQAAKGVSMPFVRIIGGREDACTCSVDLDFFQNGSMAVDLLVRAGAEKVAYLKPDHYSGSYAEKERLDGAIASADDLGIDLAVYQMDQRGSGDFEVMLRRFICEEIKAVIGTSNDCKYLLQSANALAVDIPDEMSVLAIDNHTFAEHLCPALSTMDEPFDRMACKAMVMLLDGISESRETHDIKKVCLKPTYHKRNTTRDV